MVVAAGRQGGRAGRAAEEPHRAALRRAGAARRRGRARRLRRLDAARRRRSVGLSWLPAPTLAAVAPFQPDYHHDLANGRDSYIPPGSGGRAAALCGCGPAACRRSNT